jgi:hypothetical protein
LQLQESILSAAAKDMDTLRALMRQHKFKSPLLAAPALPAVVASPFNTTTNNNDLTCEGVLADASTAAEPATLAPAVTTNTTIPSLDSSSSDISSSVVADTPTPVAQESAAPLPGLPSATKTPLKDDTTCISDSTSTRRSSLCGPVVAVPEAGAAVTHPTLLLTPAAIAAVAVTVPATTPNPAAAVVVAVPASPAASSGSSNSSSSSSSSPRRHNGKGRNNRRNKNKKSSSNSGNSSSSSSSSGSISPKAAAAASKALKNLRSPGSAAPSSAWC